jgi:hypothetical protein
VNLKFRKSKPKPKLYGSLPLPLTALQRAVAVEFACEHAVYDRQSFQYTQGRMLPGLYDDQQERREWQGNQVHALRLLWNDVQILRVLADSLEQAQLQMAVAIRAELFSLFAASLVVTNTAQELAIMSGRKDALRDKIRERYGLVFESSGQFSDVFGVAMHLIDEGAKAK